MKFHRTLQPFKLLSFDLDDTLYDNREVINLAEQQFLSCLQKTSQCNIQPEQWQAYKQQVQQQDPIFCEDVVAWRIRTIEQYLQDQGKNALQIQQISQIVMQEFVLWRHKIEVPSSTITVLNQLKSHFPLVAITNGNVDPMRIGLNQFELILRGGEQGRAKPHCDLFHQVAKQYQVSSQQILHIGDHLITDVEGAIQAGCQSVWFNCFNDKLPQSATHPTLEIHHIDELLQLI
ncbi:HAD-IA family hydrolase [Pasteurellaceae bacterium 22721_9_1]